MRLDTETQGKVKHSSTLVPSSHIIELNTIHAAAHVLERVDQFLDDFTFSDSTSASRERHRSLVRVYILTIIILLELLYESDDCTSKHHSSYLIDYL